MTGRTHSRRYDEYLRSPEWRKRRKRAIESRQYRCDRCHGVFARLEVHHRTYDRLGRERASDLEVLCGRCHEEADRERARETRRRAWLSRVDGWATKVYGEGWEFRVDPGLVEEEFERWLDEKGE